MSDRIDELVAAGVSIWLDDLSRTRLTTGSLAELVRTSHVVGVTTNPTIFQRSIGQDTQYDRQLHDLALRGVEVDEAMRTITATDVRWACEVLRPTYAASDGLDGRVSIEVDPRLAHDTAATVAEARHLWWLVDRPNLFIKIPATDEGLPAIAQCLAEGISINVTLIFSRLRYAEVIEAFLDGVERAQAARLDLTRLASVASFFVSRVDAEIDKRLHDRGGTEATRLLGKAAIANARLAFRIYQEAFGTERWRRLAEAGARPQRPLWASTGVKDPTYDDTRYVTGLVTNGVVNTMPEATLAALADHGEISGDTVRGHDGDAAAVLAAVATAGIDYDDVVQTLEDQGLTTFQHSWAALAQTIKQELAAARTARRNEEDPP